MKPSLLLIDLCSWSLLLGMPAARALDPSLDVSQYAHTSWKVRDGFTAGSISSVVQTTDGYLWVGTESGLYRFDGVRATRWHPAGAQLPGENIESLLATRDGALWIGTDTGLCSLKFGKLTTYPEMAGYHNYRLLEDGEGTVWVGAISFPPPGKLCSIRPQGVACEGADTLGIGPIDLFEDSRKTLWVALEKGMWRWRPEPKEFFSLHADLGGIRSFSEDSDGALLLGSLVQLERLVNGRVERFPLPGFSQRFQIQRMLRDSDGGLWIGTLDRGLVHMHQGKTDAYAKNDGLSGDRVTAMLEDREGNIWVATQDGLDRFRSYAIPSLSDMQGLSNAVTWSVLATKDGSVWIGNNNGLNRWKDGHLTRFDFSKGLTRSSVNFGNAPNSLFQDSSGRLWISTQHGFGQIDIGDQGFIPVQGIPVGEMRDIAEVDPGQLWIAHQQAGLLHLDQGRLVEEMAWPKLGYKDFAIAMAVDPAHKGLWLGFFKGGVSYVAEGQVRTSYSAAHGLGKGRVTDLRFGPRGALWVSTEGGLSRIKDGHVVTLTSKNGLPCDSVNWSMEDSDHSVWLYMPCGLVRITRSELDSWVADPTKTINTTVFGISDGVRGHSIASGYTPRVTQSGDGKIWFTTWDGISVLDPHHIVSNKLPPPVQVERVYADDKPFEVRNGMRLPARIHYLTIDYTALSLAAPEAVRFRYKLDGVDNDWREVLNDRKVQYSTLGPGNYHFHVKACNNSGVWNEQGASLDFVIPPMWYQTYWFYAFCAAACMVITWAAYQFRIQQLAYQFNARLEERVRERTRLARDLHDTLLQTFQGLLPMLQVALAKLPGGAADTRKTLQLALDRAAAAVSEGRDAVQGLRISTLEKNDLALAIETIAQEYVSRDATSSSPTFRLVVEGTSRDLHPILRDEVYRIGAEALRNAFRHADAQSIEVEFRYDEKYLRVRVRDDGKGIVERLLLADGRDGHYGLRGMRERAKLVGGDFTIRSEVNGGTEIDLVIPASKAYKKPARRVWPFGKRPTLHADVKKSID